MYLISGFFVLIFRILSIIGVAAVFLAFLLFDFMTQSSSLDLDDDFPRTAVVFTGDFDRIRFGLELMASERIDQLFITGVNGDAGLNVGRFPTQFGLTGEQASWISSGRIQLAPDAHTTLENALETECWLRDRPEIEAVTLITSQVHMARASVALQHGISPVKVVRMVSDPSPDRNQLEIDLVEFSRFASTWVATVLPNSFWPANEPSNCLD